jgi:hypothetical protein
MATNFKVGDIVRNIYSGSFGEIIQMPLRNPKWLTVRMITKSGTINKRFWNVENLVKVEGVTI